MDGYECGCAVRELQGSAACLRDGHGASEQASRRRASERHNRLRLDDGALGIEPDFATLNLIVVWAFVQAALAAHLVLEVLYRIRLEHFVARNTRFRERLVEHAPRGSDERLADKIFLVAGLLANQHEMRMALALPCHSLRVVPLKRVTRACLHRLLALTQRSHPGRRFNV